MKLIDKPAIIPNGEPVEEAHGDEGDEWQVNIITKPIKFLKN